MNDQTTGESVARALSDIATLLDRDALTRFEAARWLRSLVDFIRKEDQNDE